MAGENKIALKPFVAVLSVFCTLYWIRVWIWIKVRSRVISSVVDPYIPYTDPDPDPGLKTIYRIQAIL